MRMGLEKVGRLEKQPTTTANITASGNITMKSGGNTSITAGGTLTLKGSNTNIN